MAGKDDDAELLRKFQESIAGLDGADLRQLAGRLTGFVDLDPATTARPDLRHPRRAEVAVFRLRVDLDRARPPIWRRLDLRSDLPLDVVHQVLQAAFGWTDSHLHRFSLGGHSFDRDSQLFLCPYDVDEGDDDGLPAAEVRLDETFANTGDVLQYLYDYGDSWELTLLLEQVLPAGADCPAAVAVDGRRAAPPEDCGGVTDVEDLGEILDDPAHFDVDEINQALRAPYFRLRDAGVDQRLIDLIHRLGYTAGDDELADRMDRLVSGPTTLDPAELTASLRAHQWFLDRAADGGIALTSAGYLKPADVGASSEVLPAMGDWIGSRNREVQSAPLLHFRQTLQFTGLLRKHKGTLVLTRAGAAAQRDPSTLWEHLASRLLPAGDERSFESHATLLLLAFAATSENADLPLQPIGAALTEVGWRHTDGSDVKGHEIYQLPARDVLINVALEPRSRHNRNRLSPAAATLARAALRPQG